MKNALGTLKTVPKVGSLTLARINSRTFSSVASGFFQIQNKDNLVGCLEENELIFEGWGQEMCQLSVEFCYSSRKVPCHTITMSGHYKDAENCTDLKTRFLCL